MRNGYKVKIKKLIFLVSVFTMVMGQLKIISPDDGAVQQTANFDITISGIPGISAILYVNNIEVDSGIIGPGGFNRFTLDDVTPGPVELKVKSPSDTNEELEARCNIHIIGPVETIKPEKNYYELIADNQTTQNIQFELLDSWGYKVEIDSYASIVLTEGTILNTDSDEGLNGLQVSVTNGTFEVDILSPSRRAEGVLEVSVNEYFQQIPIQYKTDNSEFMLVGYVNSSLMTNDNDFDEYQFVQEDMVSSQHTFYSDDNLAVKGRAAMFATGTVKDDYLVTASFDSQRGKRDQFGEDFDPSSQYPIYGDASRLQYAAPSTSKFYMRVDKDNSYGIIGDYNTNFNDGEFSAYNRTLNGLYTSWEGNNSTISGFGAQTENSLILKLIRGEGISGYYYLGDVGISRFSEIIRIETRDQYHTEKLLESVQMRRYVDYDIDYDAGTLMFKQPVSSIDVNGDPIYIVASYEKDNGGQKNNVLGLQYQGTLAKKYHMGSTLIFEEQGSGDYLLLGINGTTAVNNWITVDGEIAGSKSSTLFDKNITGLAYKTGFKTKPTSQLDLDGYFRIVDNSFVNQSQTSGGREKGSLKYGLSSKYKLAEHSNIHGEYYRQLTSRNSSTEKKVDALNLFYDQKLNDRSNLSTGIEYSVRKAGNVNGSINKSESKILFSKYTYQLQDRLNCSVEYMQNLQKNDQSKPTSLLGGLGYDVTEKIHVFFKHRIVRGSAKSNETILGFESAVSENTELSGKYETGGAIGENRGRASIGLRNRWSVRDDLTINFAFENTATIDSLETPTQDHNALSVSCEYLPDAPWKSVAKVERRKDKTTEKWVYHFGGSLRLFDGLSLLGKFENVHTDYFDFAGQEINKGRYQFGLAYRPENQDVFNSLAKVEFITDKNSHNNPIEKYNRLIMILHGYYQPLSYLEFSSRIARRYVLEQEGDIYDDRNSTNYFSIRTEYDIDTLWSVAFDFRLIHMDDTNELETGTALELNYLLYKNTQVGVGYIFNRYDDPDFSTLDYSLNRLYLNLNIKLSENLLNWKDF